MDAQVPPAPLFCVAAEVGFGASGTPREERPNLSSGQGPIIGVSFGGFLTDSFSVVAGLRAQRIWFSPPFGSSKTDDTTNSMQFYVDGAWTFNRPGTVQHGPVFGLGVVSWFGGTTGGSHDRFSGSAATAVVEGGWRIGVRLTRQWVLGGNVTGFFGIAPMRVSLMATVGPQLTF
ncbi:MAG: hypothetical protein ACXWUG_29595 [Polyangiales bacterium]